MRKMTKKEKANRAKEREAELVAKLLEVLDEQGEVEEDTYHIEEPSGRKGRPVVWSMAVSCSHCLDGISAYGEFAASTQSKMLKKALAYVKKHGSLDD